MLKVFAGTSGYAYDAWKGGFYPDDLPKTRMLRYYAGRLNAVEINNTFYRMPKTSVVQAWSDEAQAGRGADADGFRFVLKATQRITHKARLVEAEEPVGYLLRAAQALGAHRGPLLFQLPPFLRQDVERLQRFLALLPEGSRPVFEFRHDSWFDEATFDALRASGATLCCSDTDEDDEATGLEERVVATADFAYLRLRRSSYDEARLKRIAALLRAGPWDEAFVFFKHEEDCGGPLLAERFVREFGDA